MNTRLDVVKLLYRTGLRQTECLQLRVKDLDFAQQQLIVEVVDGEASLPSFERP